MVEITGTQAAAYKQARVRGRSFGSLFFSIFGALWLLLSSYAFHRLTGMVCVILATGTLAFVSIAVWLLRTTPNETVRTPQDERDARRFNWVNTGQGAAIFTIIIQVTTRLRYPNATVPLIALIVGLHFFVLPRSMRHRSTLVTGCVITAAAGLGPLLFKGDTMVGVVTFCAGVTLWCSAAWALRTAVELYQALRVAPAASPLLT